MNYVKHTLTASLLTLGVLGSLGLSSQKVSADTTTASSATLQNKPKGTMGSGYPVKEYNAFKRSKTTFSAKDSRASMSSVPDVSEWQGNFTDSQVKALKGQVPFIILRVQYGSNYYDKTFDHNVALMKKYGVPYGVYSFSQYSSPNDAKTEAKDLYKRAPSAAFYINDYEDQTVSSGSTNTATSNWYKAIKPLVGNKKVLFYSYYPFMSAHASSAVKDYDGFWLAAYTGAEPNYVSHDLWQYTDAHYFSAIGEYTDASISSNHDKSWFLNGTSAPKVSNYNYKSVKKTMRIKDVPGHDFYNHVLNEGRYDHQLLHYGKTYAGKVVTIDSQATKKSGANGHSYYRCYSHGKEIGWMYDTALEANTSRVTYSSVSENHTIKNVPNHDFYDHVPGNGQYEYQVSASGKDYAGKDITIDSKGVKEDGSVYYRVSYNGTKVGWIYSGALATTIKYSDSNLMFKVKGTAINNFYNHITDSSYAGIHQTATGQSYAGKVITVDKAGVKDGWKTPYYRSYDTNGHLIGWIYSATLESYTNVNYSKPKVTNWTVEKGSNRAIYNHVPHVGNYEYKEVGTTGAYQGKNVTVDNMGTTKDTGDVYYRMQVDGKTIGWVSADELGYRTTYKTGVSLKVKLTATPNNDFYNHVTNSGYNDIHKVASGKDYAGKTLTVDATGLKPDQYNVNYYRCYDNGKLVGWIYGGPKTLEIVK